MARFNSFEIALMNKQNEDLGKDIHEDVSAKIQIDLDSVIAFREGFADDKSNDLGGATIVYLDNGLDFWINTSYEDFSSIIKSSN